MIDVVVVVFKATTTTLIGWYMVSEIYFGRITTHAE